MIIICILNGYNVYIKSIYSFLQQQGVFLIKKREREKKKERDDFVIIKGSKWEFEFGEVERSSSHYSLFFFATQKKNNNNQLKLILAMKTQKSLFPYNRYF